MKTHNFDYAYLGLTCARIGSQLKPEYRLSLSCSFAQGGYCFVSLTRSENNEHIMNFWRGDYDSFRGLMDGVFEYCMEHDLFKQPLDIKLVD